MNNPIELWKANRNPFRELDRFLEDFGWLPAKTGAAKALAFQPSCEVSEDKAHFIFKFDLPGMNKDQVKVEIQQNQLTVSGERKEERKEESKRCHYSETSYGSFLRSFTLPSNIDMEKVEAKFENGVLTINVAKTEDAKGRTVSVK